MSGLYATPEAYANRAKRLKSRVRFCPECQLPKPLTAFVASPRKRHVPCKECRLALAAVVDREKLKQIAKKSRAKRRQILDNLKNVPCADCSNSYPSYVMDFHHLDPIEKSFSIALKYPFVSKERLLAEVAKCVVICSNCHRIRTWAERYKATNL